MNYNANKNSLPSKLVAALLAALLAVVPMQIIAYAADAEQEEPTSAFQFTYPLEHSFEEINQYFAEHPYDTSLPDKYDILPDIANEELNAKIAAGELSIWNNKEVQEQLGGKLSDDTLNNALNATNFMRYSAGLQLMYLHTSDGIGGRQGRAQLGAALLAELGQITHYPSLEDSTAAGVSNGVFGWAKAGPAGSNCVGGYGVANKMVNSFMPDIGNDRTGLSHRSYILNPSIARTGFGAANFSGTTNKNTGKARGSAVLMMVTYGDPDPYGINAVMWPSKRQPIETFLARGTWQMAYPEGNPYQGNPWSFFFNTGSVDTSKLKVTLECDGKPTDVLDLNQLTDTEKTENRLFTIGSNPLKKLIAFRPHVAYDAGDKVNVTIEGIVDTDGLPIPVNYDVHFFTTGTTPYPNLTEISAERTEETTASVHVTSDYDGTMHYLLREAEGTEPTAAEVLAGTERALHAGENQFTLTELTDNTTKKLYYVTISSTGTGKVVEAATKSGEMSSVKSLDIPTVETEPVDPPTPPDIPPVDPIDPPESPDTPSTDPVEPPTTPDVPSTDPVDPPVTPEPTPSRPSSGGGGGGSSSSSSSRPASPTPSKPPVDFSDVPQDAYYSEAVQWAVKQGITEGVDTNVFAPEASCTRAQMVTFLWRAAGSPEPKQTETPFTDLSPDAYYWKAVLWAVENGITNGVRADSFSPNDTVTRGQTVVFLHRAADTPAADNASGFQDVTASDYYADAVAWAAQNGITTGTGDGHFRPAADCTRAQIVTLLYRAQKN